MSALIAPHLARLLLRLNGAHVPELESAVLSLCAALDEGHICLPPRGEDDSRQLRRCKVVGMPGDFKPLILDDAGRLYLQRYWAHEERLARKLIERAAAPAQLVDEALLARGLERLLNDETQRRAAANVVRRKLSVISGGPGTGKTRTASIAMILLAEQKPGLRLALAAPTGKAAARLAESLAALEVPPEVRALLPAEATTLHRLLGTIPGSPEFRRDAENPLSADVVVVDEASMVDLPLMSRLCAALRAEARLVLLGDKDQLASVEAGAVLGDICAGLAPGLDGPLKPHLTELTRNFRFAAGSAIHRFAQAVKAGASEKAIEILEGTHPDLAAQPLPMDLESALGGRSLAGFRDFVAANTPEQALAQLGEFRILAATRHGEAGVEHLNDIAERALAAAGLINPVERFYDGRPLMILRNDYQLGLFNGDTGIVRRDVDGQLRAFFRSDDGRVRAISPARLPECETAFAMTIHKAQGSEFRRVLCVLPRRDLPVLSRELLYTAATRARENVELWWSDAALRAAIGRGVERTTGLRDRLWRDRATP